MKWPTDAAGWPMSDQSQIVLHRPHRWHIQRQGTGPKLILIHGAGGATQSWRNLFPILAETCDVTAIDLPGQGFTQSGAQHRHGLDPMAEDLNALLNHLDITPDALVGHSAGVPIAMRMVELGLPTQQLFGINAALSNFDGLAGWLFPLMAKALSITPFAAQVFAATSSQSSVRQLLEGTGSKIDEAGQTLYLRLAKDTAHVDGTLSMMAQWSLDPLLARLPQFDTPTHFLTASNDIAVAPATSRTASERMPNATLTEVPDYGHLIHEEAPDLVANWIKERLA